MSVVCGYKEVQGDNIQSTIVCFISVEISHCRSWKNDERVMENHGKIMEFDFGKSLGTLLHCQEIVYLQQVYLMSPGHLISNY